MDPIISFVAGFVILPFGVWTVQRLINHDNELAAGRTLMRELKEDIQDIKQGQDAIITHLLNQKEARDARR